MYEEMTTTDLIVTARARAHPADNPSAEQAALIDELTTRLERLDVWRSRVAGTINPYLTDDDGSDLIPDHVRISNMLGRLSHNVK